MCRPAEKYSVEALSFHLYLQFNRMAEKEELKRFGMKGYFNSTVTKWIYDVSSKIWLSKIAAFLGGGIFAGVSHSGEDFDWRAKI